MIVFQPNMMRRFLLLVSAALLLGSAPLLAWQDTEDDDSNTQESDVSTEDSAEANAAEAAVVVEPASALKVKKAADTNTLYFLGARPGPKRQQGPAIGKPASILPQPFVPRGSIKVPAGPLAASPENELNGLPGSETAAPSEPDLGLREPDLTAALTENFGEETLVDPDGEAGLLAQENAPVQGEEPLIAADGLLEAGALERLDPSGVAVNGADAAYSENLWRDYSRARVMAQLGEFAEISGSPSLARIANKIALSGIVFEGEASEGDVIAFIEARLSLLMRLGNVRGYADLLAALPAGYDWAPLARHFTNAYLIEGKIGDACSLAGEQRENDSDAYWLRMVAFCEAARGNRAGVDFQLGILEEVSDVRATFYQLIDQIVVEAEQLPGAVLPATVTLPGSLKVDVLEATMARLARVEVTSLAPESVNPLAVVMMLALPGVSDDAKTELMGMAVRRGWANGDVLATFARSLSSDSEKEAAAIQLLAEDDEFNIDAVLVHLAARPAPITERAAALKRAWVRAIRNTYSAIAGESLLTLASDMAPNAQSGGVLARAALISGQTEAAARWFLALRSQEAGADQDVDAALISVAPLMTISAIEGMPVLSPNLLQRWWQSERERTDRYERANLLFTVLEALGGEVGDGAWGWLEEGPTAFGGTVPAPAHWRRFLIAANNGDAPKALAFAFRLLSEGGTAAVPASLAGSLVGTLDGMGMKDEARMIATEILISQGL